MARRRKDEIETGQKTVVSRRRKEKMSPRDAGIARSRGRELSKARKAFNALAIIGQVFALIEKEMHRTRLIL